MTFVWTLRFALRTNVPAQVASSFKMANVLHQKEVNSSRHYLSYSCLVMPNEACDSISLVCTRGSQCVRGICRCSENEIFYGGICRSAPIAQLGETCGSGEKCPEKSHCSLLQICECNSGLRQMSGKCVPDTVYGNLACASLL